MPVSVKICGITTLEDALAAVDAGAAALGFNFCAQSRRYVSPATAATIVRHLRTTVCCVGVFVDATRASVEAIASAVGLSALQFHGDESPAYCQGWPQKVIKAVRVRSVADGAAAARFRVDFVLADAYVEGAPGGTGHRVPLELLAGFDRRRLILAGGLTADNVRDAVRTVRPCAVDVASGVERAPGKKDWDLMRRFVANAHAA